MGGLFFSIKAVRGACRGCCSRRSSYLAARSDEPKLSISGYDPVAYFTDGKPVPGKSEFEYLWHKLRWRFASGAAPRSLRRRSGPLRAAIRWLLRHGCGRAARRPHKDTVDPEAWAIVDGKLYLTHTVTSLDAGARTPPRTSKQADENWSAVAHLA